MAFNKRCQEPRLANYAVFLCFKSCAPKKCQLVSLLPFLVVVVATKLVLSLVLVRNSLLALASLVSFIVSCRRPRFHVGIKNRCIGGHHDDLLWLLFNLFNANAASFVSLSLSIVMESMYLLLLIKQR